ncbi:glycosyltransferase family 2 protein [Chryseobacterium formosus]|uniref:Glycosyltransferase family 2 protein n=1 Tax=Chryseobacterium formosus TaxID=1537363 RepID=A0ABT3XN52_9FLAO|nr:glycosyltransferase family 2 protein [Chryseobacterium formosus]MCX8523566.1 glycosyltransferase family 2 protein [Chryseobacterium formosus]
MKASVCLATYNGEKFILEQLASILEQIASNDEVIISDDGSTDQTLNIIRNINDKRIKIIFNTGERGYTANFQNALKESIGDIIFISDQDDVWLPGKYIAVVENLQTNDLVVTNSMVTDEALNVTNESFFSIYNSGTGLFKNLTCSTYYGCCMAFNRKVLNYSMPFPNNKEVAIDLWMGLVGEVVGKVKFIEKPYLLYRRSGNNVTQLGSLLTRSNRPLHMKIYKRMITLISVLKLTIKYKLNLVKEN